MSSWVKLVALQVDVKDHTKGLVLLSVYNFDLKGKSYDYYFAKGKVIYVKEPFFKIATSGHENIRIENPSDLLFENDPEVKQLQEFQA